MTSISSTPLNFPLYQTIYKATEETDHSQLTHEQKIELMNNIKLLEKQAHEYIYLLIKIYSLEKDVYSLTDNPYQCKLFKSGMKWEIDKLPPRLLSMIWYFTTLEIRRRVDDSQRTSFFK